MQWAPPISGVCANLDARWAGRVYFHTWPPCDLRPRARTLSKNLASRLLVPDLLAASAKGLVPKVDQSVLLTLKLIVQVVTNMGDNILIIQDITLWRGIQSNPVTHYCKEPFLH